MRQLLLVALLAALAASAITFAVCEALRPQAPAASPGLTAAEMKAALADVVREVAALRREAAAARAAAGPAADGSTAAAASGTTVPSRAQGDQSAAASAPVVRPGRPESSSSAANATPLERFRQALPERDDMPDEEARRAELRRWMFRGEREVFEWFGQPDRVDPEGETEMWFYLLPTGERGSDGQPLRREFYIRLSRGRLIDLGG